jgi:hypothetical protein
MIGGHVLFKSKEGAMIFGDRTRYRRPVPLAREPNRGPRGFRFARGLLGWSLRLIDTDYCGVHLPPRSLSSSSLASAAERRGLW